MVYLGDNINGAIGEIRYGRDCGHSGSKANRKYIYQPCRQCGRERWVFMKRGLAVTDTCRSCSCFNHRYKDGRTTLTGYTLLRLYPDDFFYPMCVSARGSFGWILEHRYVMAKHIGRCLQPWEHVHHRNGLRKDNRLENLLIVLSSHHSGEVKCPYCGKEFAIH